MKSRPSSGSGEIRTFLGIVGAFITNFFRQPGSPYLGYGEEPWRRKGARKSGGGRRHGTHHPRTPLYRAWKKAFGGVAVPAYKGDAAFIYAANTQYRKFKLMQAMLRA